MGEVGWEGSCSSVPSPGHYQSTRLNWATLKAPTGFIQAPLVAQTVTNLPAVQVLCLVTQSCKTLCDPMDCSLPIFSAHGDSPGKITGVGCHALFQGILPTQEPNWGLLHYRWIPYQLSYRQAPAVQETKIWFPDQGSNLRPLQWKHEFLTTGLAGKSLNNF